MNKSKVLLLVAVVICLAVLAISCNRNTQTPTTGPNLPPPREKVAESYIPLKVGNTWVYDTEVDKTKMVLTFKVTGTEKIDGKDMFVYEGSTNGITVQKEYIEQTKDGYIVHKRTTPGPNGKELVFNIDPPQPLLQLPLTAGKTWSWKGKMDGKDAGVLEGTSDYKVIGEEEIETPAGKFKATNVEVKATVGKETYTLNRWYVVNVGVVKEATGAETKEKMSSVLKGYIIDGKTVGDVGAAAVTGTPTVKQSGEPEEETTPAKEETPASEESPASEE